MPKRESFFDQRPRRKPDQLFGREEEIEKLLRALEAGSWVSILGPRMVGKTSLALAGANAFARDNKYRVIFVDSWHIALLEEGNGPPWILNAGRIRDNYFRPRKS